MRREFGGTSDMVANDCILEILLTGCIGGEQPPRQLIQHGFVSRTDKGAISHEQRPSRTSSSSAERNISPI